MDERLAATQDDLVSGKRRKWLDAPILTVGGLTFARREIATKCGIPSTRCAANLDRRLHREGITTLNQLFKLGLDGLAAIKGIGEASSWIAVCALFYGGYNVNDWIPPSKTTKGAIRAAAERKKRKTRSQRRRATAR